MLPITYLFSCDQVELRRLAHDNYFAHVEGAEEAARRRERNRLRAQEEARRQRMLPFFGGSRS